MKKTMYVVLCLVSVSLISSVTMASPGALVGPSPLLYALTPGNDGGVANSTLPLMMIITDGWRIVCSPSSISAHGNLMAFSAFEITPTNDRVEIKRVSTGFIDDVFEAVFLAAMIPGNIPILDFDEETISFITIDTLSGLLE